MNNDTIKVKLSNDTTVLMSVAEGDGKGYDGPVTAQGLMIGAKQTFKVIKGLADDLRESIANAKPDKASVEFSLELEKKDGDILSKICNVSGKGGIKITLEWDFTNKE